MVSEKIGCEFVCMGRSPFWHDIVMDKWIMQSLPKSLLWSTYPSPAAVTPAADSSQLHPSLGIVLGPRKQTHPKLAPPGSQWLADEGIQRPTHLLPFGTTLKGHPTSSAKSQWHLHLQSDTPSLPPQPFPLTFRKGVSRQNSPNKHSACSSALRVCFQQPNLRSFYVKIWQGNISGGQKNPGFSKFSIMSLYCLF